MILFPTFSNFSFPYKQFIFWLQNNQCALLLKLIYKFFYKWIKINQNFIQMYGKIKNMFKNEIIYLKWKLKKLMII